MKAEGTVDFQLHYQSSPDLKNPSIEAYFSIKDGMLTEPTFGAKIKNLQCLGSYKNLPTDQLLIDRFGFTSQGAQFAGQLKLQDFLNPQLHVKAGGDIPLALVQALYPIAAVEEIKGVAKLRINGQFAQNAAQEWQTNALTGNVALSGTIGVIGTSKGLQFFNNQTGALTGFLEYDNSYVTGVALNGTLGAAIQIDASYSPPPNTAISIKALDITPRIPEIL
jgi:hypothetical protein